jgi:hypothetical protein
MYTQERIKVVNMRESGEYIGRGSPLGNPFSHRMGTKAQFVVDSREQAIAQYRDWLLARIEERDPAICQELNRLAMKVLLGPLKLRCYCAPKACHGDVIKDILLHYLNGTP